MNNDEEKVVSVSTNEEVVQKPKVEEFDISKSLEEHMEENKTNVKTKIDFKILFTYIIVIIIVVVGVLLLVHFCESSINDLNKKSTTTNPNYQLIKTTKVEPNSIEYVTTTTVPTAATHTIFVDNTTKVTSTKEPERTNNVQIKTTTRVVSDPTTKTTTTTTTKAKTTTTTTTKAKTTTTTTTKKTIMMPAGVKLIADVNKNDILDIGDEIAIGEEQFYVIYNSSERVDAFAKYNLNVGDNRNKTKPEGIQDETVKGWVKYGTIYGNVAFSNIYGWKYDTSIIVKDYEGPVRDALYGENGYEKYIQKTISNAKVQLLSKYNIESLINNGKSLSYVNNIKSKADDKRYSWLYSTSYWIQYAHYVNNYNVLAVISDGRFSSTAYDSDSVYGVRPVVTIPKV